VTEGRRKVVDFLLLQTGWFACVLGGAAERGWSGPLYVALAYGLHLLYTPGRGRELAIAGVATLVGAGTDAVHVARGTLAFADEGPTLLGLPPWIVVLWPLFAATFGSTLRWLTRRPGLALVLGAVGGPPGYLAADRLGALTLARPLPAALAELALAWGLAMPLLMRAAATLGVTGAPAAAPPRRVVISHDAR